MKKRYITTLLNRLGKEDPPALSFNYECCPDLAPQIADALHFWRFYQHLRADEALSLKDAPEDATALRHELLKHIAQEDSLRGLVACWLRLPATVIETLKWSENLDIQSRESFLRRISAKQKEAIRAAYEEFFTYNRRPACLDDGIFRRLMHRHVTVESLGQERLMDPRRTESKSAWGKSYAHMDFGHALYPDGPDVDTSDSGSFRQFLSVKNHANDFSVNQHDGLYWWLYRNLRSNYLWNRHGEVVLKPMICPGFWFTILSWAFLAIVSPFFALTTTLPLLAGVMSFGAASLLGALIGSVAPILLMLSMIFYILRDTPIPNWISGFFGGLANIIEGHFSKHAEKWVFTLFYTMLLLMSALFASFGLLAYETGEPFTYWFVTPMLVTAFWGRIIADRGIQNITPRKHDRRWLIGFAVLTVLMLALPYTFEILAGALTVFKGLLWGIGVLLLAIVASALRLIVIGALIFGTWYLHSKTVQLRTYQNKAQKITQDRVKKDYRLMVSAGCIVTAMYIGAAFWFGSSVMTGTAEEAQVSLLPLLATLIIIGGGLYLVGNTYTVRKTDPEDVLKRNAYINALSAAGYDTESSEMMDFRYNHWVLNHENPIEAARNAIDFAAELSCLDSDVKRIYNMVRYNVDKRSMKHVPAFDYWTCRDAFHELGEQHYLEFVRQALEGQPPEQALTKARKLKERAAGKKAAWKNMFPVRMAVAFGKLLTRIIDAIINFFDAIVRFFKRIGSGIAKAGRDLYEMWQILHKYCPAVAEKKQI